MLPPLLCLRLRRVDDLVLGGRERTEGLGTLVGDGQLDLLINIPGEGSRASSTSVDDSVTDGYLVRRAAVDFGCGLITNIKCATMYVEALHRQHTPPVRPEPGLDRV